MSTFSNSIGTNKDTPVRIEADHDPLVSCPIVCGEFMRATGFFFRTNSQTYLITAQHNLLPTTISVSNSDTGDRFLNYSVTNDYSVVDLYLRSDGGWERRRIDCENSVHGALADSKNIDMVALRVGFAPEQFGYRVWSPESISTPREDDNDFMIVGFDGESFPSTDSYCLRDYHRHLSNPRFVPCKNSVKFADETEFPPTIGTGIDANPAGGYDGLSGSPVVGDGLVGIHVVDGVLSRTLINKTDAPNGAQLCYFRASLLSKLSE